MKTLAFLFSALVLAACATTATLPENVPFQSQDTELGPVLTDNEGMTLYTFTRDEPGQSNCYDQCAEKWPPMQASDSAQGAGMFSVIERDDGTRQWAYDGDPLYLWVGDQEPGDVTGHEVGNVWFVIKLKDAAKNASDDSGYY